jgi:hypothetical protein
VPPPSANPPPVNAAAEAARTAPDSASGKVNLQGAPAATPAKVSPSPSPTPSRPTR